MRRFFQPSGPAPDGTLVLEEAESRHAAQVLRLRTGEQATVLDGMGGEYHCTATAVDRRAVRFAVGQIIRHEPPPVRVRLVQAITKGKSFDWIIQKAVELGASAMQPLITDRVVARPEPLEFGAKAEKWRQVAIEAIKQCGALWLPVIHEPCSIAAAFDLEGLNLVAALEGATRHPREALESFLGSAPRAANSHASTKSHEPKMISVWIGPEGDFTAAELDQLTAAGAVPVTLGPTVLRSETAALYALSVLRYELTRESGRHESGPGL